MPDTEPLDPTAIRASLRFDYGPRLGDGSWNDDQDEDVIALLDERDRLAADLAEANRKLAAAWDEGYEAGETFEAARWVGSHARPRPRLDVVNPYRGALGGAE